MIKLIPVVTNIPHIQTVVDTIKPKMKRNTIHNRKIASRSQLDNRLIQSAKLHVSIFYHINIINNKIFD
jgi:hypothetical protein